MRPIRLIALIALLVSLVACGTAPGAGSDGQGQDPGGPEGGESVEPVDNPGASAGEPGGGDPDNGGGVFSDPDPGLPSQEEFLARVEPMIEALAPPNSTEVRRAEEGELVLFVEFESTDSYDVLEAYYQETIGAAGFLPVGGPSDFPESSDYFIYHPDAPDFEGGVTIRGNQVTLVFTGIPPANFGGSN